MQPQRIRVMCLLCPEGHQATFQQLGDQAMGVVNQWLAHIQERHPQDAEAADQSRVRMEKFIDGIGGSAAQHQLFVYGDRILARQKWETGLLAIDGELDQEAWILKHCGRRELNEFRAYRKKQQERQERVAQGLVHVYRCEIGTEAAFKFHRDLFRMSGKIRGMQPKNWLMLLEDPSPEQLQILREDGKVTEVDPEAHL